MNRMQDIYASMMVAFRKKIVKELREEMQKEMHQQLSALKAEMNEMNNRLMDLEKSQTSSPNLHQELKHYSREFQFKMA